MGISVELFCDLGDLPLFNPDLEANHPPVVARLHAQLIAADAVLIASPEYAHGISGVMKNALDWIVGCEAFVNKPVASLNASPRAVYAPAALKQVMSALVVEGASIAVSMLGSRLDEDGIFADPAISCALREALHALCDCSSAQIESRTVMKSIS